MKKPSKTLGGSVLCPQRIFPTLDQPRGGNRVVQDKSGCCVCEMNRDVDDEGSSFINRQTDDYSSSYDETGATSYYESSPVMSPSAAQNVKAMMHPTDQIPRDVDAKDSLIRMLRDELSKVVQNRAELMRKHEDELLEMEMKVDQIRKTADKEVGTSSVRMGDAKAALEEALLAVSERHRENQALLAQLKALRREAVAVANDRDAAVEECAQLREECEDLGRQRDAQQLLSHSLAAELGELRSSTAAIKWTSSRNAEATAADAELRESLRRTQEERDQAQHSLRMMREDFLRASEALGVAEGRNEALTRSLETINEALPADRRALEKVMEERDTAEKCLVQERREAETIRGELAKAKGQIKALASTVEEFEASARAQAKHGTPARDGMPHGSSFLGTGTGAGNDSTIASPDVSGFLQSVHGEGGASPGKSSGGGGIPETTPRSTSLALWGGKDLAERIRSLEGEIDELGRQLQLSREECSRLKLGNTPRSEGTGDSSNELRSLVSKLRGERDALRGEGEAARRERDAAVAEKESLQEKMKVLDNEAQNLRASLASERNTIAAERDTLSREWGALKGKLGIDAAGGDHVGDATVQKAVLENVLDELNSTFKQVQEQRAAAQQAIVDLERGKGDRRRDLMAFQARLSQDQIMMSALRGDAECATARGDAVQEMLEECERARQEAVARAEHLAESLANIETDSGNTLAKLEQERDGLAQKATAAEDRVEELKLQLGGCRDAAEALDRLRVAIKGSSDWVRQGCVGKRGGERGEGKELGVLLAAAAEACERERAEAAKRGEEAEREREAAQVMRLQVAMLEEEIGGGGAVAVGGSMDVARLSWERDGEARARDGAERRLAMAEQRAGKAEEALERARAEIAELSDKIASVAAAWQSTPGLGMGSAGHSGSDIVTQMRNWKGDSYGYGPLATGTISPGGDAKASAIQVAQLIKENDGLRRTDEQRRALMETRQKEAAAQRSELEKLLFDAVVERDAERRLKADAEAASSSAVRELKRLRASLPMSLRVEAMKGHPSPPPGPPGGGLGAEGGVRGGSELMRLASMSLPHAVACVEKCMRQLSECGAPAGMIAGLGLSLDVLKVIGDRMEKAGDPRGQAEACLREVMREGDLGEENGGVREGVYGVALRSTVAEGRRDIADREGVSERLFALMRCGDAETERWATLGIGSLSMLEGVRTQLLGKAGAHALVTALAPALEGTDEHRKCYACLALGNLMVDEQARNVLVGEEGVVEALCGLVNSPDMLTRRYAVGAIRNLAVNKDARHIFHGHTAMMGQLRELSESADAATAMYAAAAVDNIGIAKSRWKGAAGFSGSMTAR